MTPADFDMKTIAAVIQTAVAPVFLLAGISALLAVMTGRLARVIDRSRVLELGLVNVNEPEHKILIKGEMNDLLKRGRYINTAITLATLSALLVCMVIIFLFLGTLIGDIFTTLVAMLFIGCMFLLVIALSLFLCEVYIATRSMRSGLAKTESLIHPRSFYKKQQN